MAVLAGSAAEATGIAPSPLASQDPPLGTDATIVGFGRSGRRRRRLRPQAPRRRRDRRLPGDLPDGLVCWNFDSPLGAPGTDSNTCNGDSGGPLFVEDAAGTPVLTGLTSGGSSDTCLPADQSYDDDVAVQRSYIEVTRRETSARPRAAGCRRSATPGPRWSASPSRSTPGRPRASTAFDLPDGVRRLRVALNAGERHRRRLRPLRPLREPADALGVGLPGVRLESVRLLRVRRTRRGYLVHPREPLRGRRDLPGDRHALHRRRLPAAAAARRSAVARAAALPERPRAGRQPRLGRAGAGRARVRSPLRPRPGRPARPGRAAAHGAGLRRQRRRRPRGAGARAHARARRRALPRARASRRRSSPTAAPVR